MYFYDNDKDDPTIFGHSFDDMNPNSNNNSFLNFSQSLPSQSFDTSSFQNDTSPSPNNMLAQLNDYPLFEQDNMLFPSDNLNPSIFLETAPNSENSSMDPQQIILLSDPNFVRQQQLLQEQQQKANKIMMDHKEPPHSNLSAMFSAKPEPVHLISSQQQKDDIAVSQSKRLMTGKSPVPIPLSTSSPSSNNPTTSSSSNNNNSGIDHQRRLNELQARFRVNYAKKPQKTQPSSSSSLDITGTSMPTTYSEQHNGFSHLSSSFTDGTGPNRRKLSLDPTTSKSLHRMSREPGKVKVVGSNNGKSSGMAIPGSNSNSTVNSNAAASSFPSRTMPIQIQRVHRANALQSFDLEQRQKRLDDQLVKVDFEDITVSELKEMLRQRGKPATGKKAVLVQRLQEEREMIQHARANGIPITQRYAQPAASVVESSPVMASSPMLDQAGSLPDLSSSPITTGLGSLNRSIADMHIGSPPVTSQQSRRFAPYNSPRINNSNNNNNLSPGNMGFYSSSVPTGSLDMMMMQQQQQQQLQQPQQQQMEPRVMRGFNFGKKSYAPFTSSALATPDRDDDHNPFDQLDTSTESSHNAQSKGFESPNDMEWTDPSLEFLLQQGMSPNEFQDKSTEELLSFLAANQDFDTSQFLLNDDLNNFQNLNGVGGGGGPDLGSVMFDDFNIHNRSNNNNNNHL